MTAEPLSDYVNVAGRFRRSTNLEKDYIQASQNGDYILTPTARQSLHRLIEGLEHTSLAKAWTLTGPYGVGKSAFAVFLTRVLCAVGPQGQQARALVEHCDPGLAALLRKLKFFDGGAKGYLPVLVTARRTSAPACIAEALIAATENAPEKKLRLSVLALKETLAQEHGKPMLDTRQVATSLSTVSDVAKSVGYSGVLLILDELGKLFEYAARYPQNGDVFVLQELAERASRSKDQPIVIVGLLHQSFQEYGTHLDLGTRREWAKIQGRFEDIAFVEPAEQVIRLIAQAIRWTSASKEVTECALALSELASTAKLAPPGMHQEDFSTIAQAAFPLHPTTLVALPFVFRRFAQNERSLFSYLSSLEPFGFQEFIRTHSLATKPLPTVRLGHLFDYFTKTFGAGLSRQPHALRWNEAIDVLDRADNLPPLHREIVKTVGMLNALGEFCHLHATESNISAAVVDSHEPTVELRQALVSLRERSILTFRKYNRTYRIWEGSDVDIEQRIAEGERKIRQHLNLARSVAAYLSVRPLVARRHSFETGALRYFSIHYLDDPQALDVESTTTDGDGRVLVCLSESPVTAELFRECALAARDRTDVLFAIPQYIGELRAVVAELGSLKWAWDNTPELRDDRVARREVSTRIAEVEQLLRRNLDGLLDPREEPVGSGCLWIHRGKIARVAAPADVSQLLSTACDCIYPKSPRIRNELIVRRTLSNAAAAARRNLVERMLTRHNEENLGIEGYPPERSMYDSVLRATGMHRRDQDGQWKFLPPESSDPTNLVSAWSALKEAVFERQPAPMPLPILFSIISAAPFGVMPGLHPVLLCAFLLVYPDETTLYREGTFLPEFTTADFEVLMRRPELYSLAGSQVTGGRAAIVERLAKGLGTRSATVPVTKAMFRMVKALPEFAWNTRKLPAPTLALREAFQNAKSPEKFLFVSLPEALGSILFSDAYPSAAQIERLFGALNASLQLLSLVTDSAIETARDLLLKACGFEAGPSQWNDLRKSAIEIEPIVTDPKLLTFLQRLTQNTADSAGVESVIALVANRPPRNWSDADVERFPETAGAVGKSFRQAARSAGAVTSPRSHWESLTNTERRQAEGTLDSLRRFVRTKTIATSTRALRAALSRLLEEINE